jgi:formylmethanofuran dehydrogenase subunit A
MLRIAAGRVYDPANGIAGEVRDVCVQDGKIVADVPGHARSIDARGMVVMPGGVDIHAHIAGPAVNAARKLAPEEHRADVLERTAIARSGTGGTVPSTFATGYRYALLGYTTVVDAATPPLAARHTLAELRDTPVIDALFLVLLGNNLPLFELIRSEPGRVREAIAWWLQATGGYGVKLVNPGGVEMWKRGNGNVTSLDDEGPGVTPRSVIVPFAYRERNYVHALQWGIGLELFLLSRDPWRIVLSTDHPNGASFLSYPRLIRLLMDREFRNEQIRRVNKQAMKRTVLLDDLDREYTLEEIAIITRAGPARLLGLRDKGHLGVGADADITIYDDRDDREAMFAAPRYVIKDGRAVVEDGELREVGPGRLLRVGADYDPSIEPTLEALFEDRYSVQFASYPVRERWLLEPARTIAADPR